MSVFSGYLVASPAARDFAITEFELHEPDFPDGPTLKHVSARTFGINRWDEFSLRCSQPLMDEVNEGTSGYRYQLFVVRGFAKMIMLAHQRRIVDYALAQIFDRRIFPNLRKASIFVDKMIERCRHPESEFLVTSLHGRFAGANTNLRSISLYGDDVTQSPVYAEHHQLFNFHSSGLGRRLFDGLPRVHSNDDREIVRISSSGALSLPLTTRTQALELLQVMSYVMVNRWVEDWVPGEREDGAWPT
jgi:hypothetical protein